MTIHYMMAAASRLEEAVTLVAAAYREERQALPILPGEEDLLPDFREALKELLAEGSGVMALSRGRLVGFLTGFKVDALFGNTGGIYAPLYGRGALKENRRRLYQELYRQAAALWVQEGCLTHAVSLFTHDTETVDTWFWLGFGLRCVDAVREVRPLQTQNPRGLTIKKIAPADLSALAEVHGEHDSYYRKSPLFMPRLGKDPLEDFRNWLQGKDHHVSAACEKDKPLGYIRIQPAAESFVSRHRKMMNITGAYVLEGERQAGIGTLLLAEVQEWLAREGYTLYGVDFESFNIPGSSFWLRHFMPYSYSLVRRVDERILS